MQSDCQNIHRIIDANFGLPFDEESFLQHIESCPNCKTLYELNPEIERYLAKLLPHPAPRSLSEDILKSVRKSEKFLNIDKKYKAVEWAVSIFSIAIAAVIFILNRNTILSIFEMSKIQSAFNYILGFSHSLSTLKDNLGGGPIFMAYLPIILTALVGTIALIWAYCIIQFREIFK